MASSSGPLNEELQCSICLDVFTDPVTTPCGHNFCRTCLNQCWTNTQTCFCPSCKETFCRRPDLKINTTLTMVVQYFKLNLGGSEVFCDFCDERKQKAVKSCLTSQSSYCETHLEPHHRVPRLKKYKLINAVKSQEKTHSNDFFLTSSRTVHISNWMIIGLFILLVAILCILPKQYIVSTDPQSCSDDSRITKLQQKIADLIRSIERRESKLLKMMEEQQKAAEKQAEDLIKELQQEITDLKRRNTELEQLSHTDDHLHLLQMYSSLYSLSHTKNWIEISTDSDVDVFTLKRALTVLKKHLTEKLSQTGLKWAQKFAVDVTLDPDTANPHLILSDDGKQVSHGNIEQDVPENAKRFDYTVCVLAKEGFSSGRFYYEVQVKGKTKWSLGVARESINRKGTITLTRENGFWTVWLRNENQYEALESPSVFLSLKGKPEKVGVFVDYEEGLVSFYDVGSRSHIYSFTGQTFTEKLYPYFSPCLHEGGKNSKPLIITPLY